MDDNENINYLGIISIVLMLPVKGVKNFCNY